MLVKSTFMFVDVRVHDTSFGVVVNRCKPMSDPLRDSGEIKDTKEKSIKPTASSIAKPMRAGIARLNKMMATPTRKIVMV
jgi:F0F1-type ATP synthase alpha subunit